MILDTNCACSRPSHAPLHEGHRQASAAGAYCLSIRASRPVADL